MTSVDALATHRHLVDHVAPVWQALAPEYRGHFYSGSGGPVLAEYAQATYQVAMTPGYPHGRGGPTIVANVHDLQNTHPQRPIAYVEHGAGQTYADMPWHPSFSGGQERQAVNLFLALNEATASRDRARYPDAQVVVTGSPHLDWLAGVARVPRGSRTRVAFAFHWDSGLLPETRATWPYWREAVQLLARDARYEVRGHGHPRAWDRMERWYRKLGVEAVRDLQDVVAWADVVCFDNSSAGYEAAALGLRVVALNAPFYRRDVWHGLRFWSEVPGPQANTVEDLWAAIQASEMSPWPSRRLQIASNVYPYRGGAAMRAAGAVCTMPVPIR